MWPSFGWATTGDLCFWGALEPLSCHSLSSQTMHGLVARLSAGLQKDKRTFLSFVYLN